MQMLAAVESVGDSEGQSESQLQSMRAPCWGLLPPVGQPPVQRVGDSEGQSQNQLAVTESMPAEACGSYQAPDWATLAEKQKKSWVGLEDNTACYDQEKKLLVNIAICLVSPPPSVSHTIETSTPFENKMWEIHF